LTERHGDTTAAVSSIDTMLISVADATLGTREDRDSGRLRGMEDTTDLLFVYGTLRQGLARGEASVLVHDLESIGAATVRGLLYDLGSYPGMVVGDGVVHGDLLRVTDPARLTALDAYEECGGSAPLFQRTVTTAHRQGGSVTAWVYLYARPIADGTRIEHGDYALCRMRHT
jgi:gamma-glutamylcyclotransferase (GGCT)/AIG2-like uncharacterized protein YtfP